ncbi:hypothetical protein VN97_g7525 [Penicillium thymicola]|uniref:Uncharacterized protein n=1 Tax=Penicillium thymicola TaxID=293382 RepID=A0AAI9X6M4_PENTH|nr:hypothetical protein VN97_g7525 [Penicillium thymicola]
MIDPTPAITPTSLNATILSQLDIALHGLRRKEGIPNHSRVMLNNVNITTNILAAERTAPLAPDTSLLHSPTPSNWTASKHLQLLDPLL